LRRQHERGAVGKKIGAIDLARRGRRTVEGLGDLVL
jgi:hypothetical protein